MGKETDVILQALKPGTTIKFPLSVKMSTVNQQKNECSIEPGHSP
jgi:hypothetical protein